MQKIWIEDGCTSCGLCESSCPDVFELGSDKAEIKAGADLAANEDCIKDAAANCPMDVIRFE
jgi:ferredoxin